VKFRQAVPSTIGMTCVIFIALPPISLGFSVESKHPALPCLVGMRLGLIKYNRPPGAFQPEQSYFFLYRRKPSIHIYQTIQ
jgi:hypothetical protein